MVKPSLSEVLIIWKSQEKIEYCLKISSSGEIGYNGNTPVSQWLHEKLTALCYT